MIPETIQEQIVLYRRRNRVTVRAMALEAGVNYQNLSKVLCGSMKPYGGITAYLMKKFGYTKEQLLGLPDQAA